MLATRHSVLKGFSLLEMSIVLLIISSMAAGAIAYLTVSLDRRGLYETQHKLEVIQETDHTADCPGLPTGTDNPTVVVVGMVPTQTLGLPDDYAFDGWGRRMQYV